MKYSTIKGNFSENRRIPLLGRIRLGLKAQKVRPDGSAVEYPTETDYFVVPPEVEAVTGPQPRELTIMLPSDDPEKIFPQNLAWFGKATGLKCTGNMVEATRLNAQTGAWEPRACPCEMYKSDTNPKGECTESGTLVFMLPSVSMGGTYQIRTGSYYSVVDINSGLDFVRALIGRIAMVPLKLRRVARETHNAGHKQIHHTLSLVLDANVAGVNALREDSQRIIESAWLIQIEGPAAIDPENDGLPPDVTVKEYTLTDTLTLKDKLWAQAQAGTLAPVPQAPPVAPPVAQPDPHPAAQEPPAPTLPPMEEEVIEDNGELTEAELSRIAYWGGLIGQAATFRGMTEVIRAVGADPILKRECAKQPLRDQYWLRKKVMGWKTAREKAAADDQRRANANLLVPPIL